MILPNYYYEPKLGLEGTAPELFIHARNGYIRDPDALAKIEEILRAEDSEQEARTVGYIRRAIEAEQAGKQYSAAMFQKGIMLGYRTDEAVIRDGLTMTVMQDRGDVLIVLEESFPAVQSGGTCMPKDRFLELSEDEFTELTGSLYFYGMQEVAADESTTHD